MLALCKSPGIVIPAERALASESRNPVIAAGRFCTKPSRNAAQAKRPGRPDHANKQSGVYWIPALAPKRRSAGMTTHRFRFGYFDVSRNLVAHSAKPGRNFCSPASSPAHFSFQCAPANPSIISLFSMPWIRREQYDILYCPIRPCGRDWSSVVPDISADGATSPETLRHQDRVAGQSGERRSS